MAEYSELRQVLGAPYRSMSAPQIEGMMEAVNIDAEDMEDFLSTLGNIGRGVVSALPQVLPTALPLVGTAIGGPVGGMLGGVAGQALGSSISGQRPAASGQQPAMPQSGQPMPAAPVQVPGGSPAAGQLLQTMFRPETIRALIAMMMGHVGRQSIPIGNTQVPNGGFTNLLSTLANQAAAEHDAIVTGGGYAGEATPSYMENYAGDVSGDPAIPEHRAAALLLLLQESDIEPDESYASQEQYSDTDEGVDEALYDEMDLNELYGEYEFA